MLMISLLKTEKNRQHLHAHNMLRQCLRSYGINYIPGETPLDTVKNGKPVLRGCPGVHFNLSHADGIAACIVSERECGIDCESVRPYRSGVVRRAFSESEKALIENAPENERDLLFFRIWTLKEAYIKALGTGLAFPLNTLSFSFESGGIQANVPGCDFRQYILHGGEYVVSECFMIQE